MIDRIKSEAFARSEVMEHLRNLTDVHGPRLTGSPPFEEAAKWASDRLTSFGLSNVHIERWGPFGRSWAIEQYSAEQLAPYYARLTAMPLARTASTPGPITGEPILTPLEISFDRGFKRNAESFAVYRREWTGKLRGKILLLTPLQRESPRTQPLFKRYDDADLAATAKAPEPKCIDARIEAGRSRVAGGPRGAIDVLRGAAGSLLDELIDRFDAMADERSRFFAAEGVAGIIVADRRAREGLLAAEAAGSFHAKDPLAPPTFVVTSEHYDRMVRLIEQKQTVRVRLDLKVAASAKDVDGGNIVAEIPGGARKDEIVMVGAHFDSWHSGTGATDNGTGSAVMIAVMRILKLLDLKLERTVRLALWSGEEQGLLGSRGNVKAHFGDPTTMAVTPEHGKLSGYFDLDNGSGKIRGVYLQGNQDLLDYGTLTHHTSADTYEHAVAADLMQASAVIASVVYHTANRSEMLLRRAQPKRAPATASH